MNGKVLASNGERVDRIVSGHQHKIFLCETQDDRIARAMAEDWKNKLYFGDNIEILRKNIEDESVDLIYLDPPFNSQATYNVLFAEKSGEKSAAQITAFEDTWRWGIEAEATYREIVKGKHRKLGDVVQAIRSFLGANDMMAYLVTCILDFASSL
jgi:16S rRNA G966 N2-methylase RsmD